MGVAARTLTSAGKGPIAATRTVTTRWARILAAATLATAWIPTVTRVTISMSALKPPTSARRTATTTLAPTLAAVISDIVSTQMGVGVTVREQDTIDNYDKNDIFFIFFLIKISMSVRRALIVATTTVTTPSGLTLAAAEPDSDSNRTVSHVAI